jgi:hypothetical protein
MWNMRFAELVAFRKEHNRLPKQLEGKLGSWIQNQRYLIVKKMMRKDREEKLVSLDFWKAPKARLGFAAQLAKVAEFYKVHGMLPTQKENPWVHGQRQLYKKGKLDLKRIAEILEAIPNWTWEETDPFPENLAEVVEFKKVHGRLTTQKENRWVSDQRLLHKKGKLAHERVAAILEAFPGFFETVRK